MRGYRLTQWGDLMAISRWTHHERLLTAAQAQQLDDELDRQLDTALAIDDRRDQKHGKLGRPRATTGTATGGR